MSLELGHAAPQLSYWVLERSKSKEANAPGYYSGEDFTESCLGSMW